MYLNIASYLYGKQIKSKIGNKLYLQMIFICVRLNWLDIHEWHTMPLNALINKYIDELNTVQNACCRAFAMRNESTMVNSKTIKTF